MPRVDQSADKPGSTIVWSQAVDCPHCDETLQDVRFDTGAEDEDGLADLSPGDVTSEVTCPACGFVWEAEYQGWIMFGEAG